MNNRDQIKDILSALPAGKISDTDALESLLEAEWDNLQGSDAGGMQANKLNGRIEDLSWEPPCITFSIKRHGATVKGSTRGEVQDWEIDTSSWKATYSERYYQVYASQKPFDAKPLAENIANMIIHGQQSSSLKRYPDGRVKVLIGTIIPEGLLEADKTVAGRR